MLPLHLALLGFLAAPIPSGLRADEVKDAELVETLATIRVVYDNERPAAYRLRVFLHQEDGECVGDDPCEKQRLYVSVATYDEYPERKAFRLRLTGPFRRMTVVAVPGSEEQPYRITIVTEPRPGKERCTSYRLSLRELVSEPPPCK